MAVELVWLPGVPRTDWEGRRKGHWTEATSALWDKSCLIDIPSSASSWVQRCNHPTPRSAPTPLHHASHLPAHLPFPWDTLCLPGCGPVTVQVSLTASEVAVAWAASRASLWGAKPGSEVGGRRQHQRGLSPERLTPAICLQGAPGVRRDFVADAGTKTRRAGQAGAAKVGKEGRQHSYSASRYAEFYFAFYLFLLLKSCFFPRGV